MIFKIFTSIKKTLLFVAIFFSSAFQLFAALTPEQIDSDKKALLKINELSVIAINAEYEYSQTTIKINSAHGNLYASEMNWYKPVGYLSEEALKRLQNQHQDNYGKKHAAAEAVHKIMCGFLKNKIPELAAEHKQLSNKINKTDQDINRIKDLETILLNIPRIRVKKQAYPSYDSCISLTAFGEKEPAKWDKRKEEVITKGFFKYTPTKKTIYSADIHSHPYAEDDANSDSCNHEYIVNILIILKDLCSCVISKDHAQTDINPQKSINNWGALDEKLFDYLNSPTPGLPSLLTTPLTSDQSKSTSEKAEIKQPDPNPNPNPNPNPDPNPNPNPNPNPDPDPDPDPENTQIGLGQTILAARATGKEQILQDSSREPAHANKFEGRGNSGIEKKSYVYAPPGSGVRLGYTPDQRQEIGGRGASDRDSRNSPINSNSYCHSAGGSSGSEPAKDDFCGSVDDNDNGGDDSRDSANLSTNVSAETQESWFAKHQGVMVTSFVLLATGGIIYGTVTKKGKKLVAKLLSRFRNKKQAKSTKATKDAKLAATALSEQA